MLRPIYNRIAKLGKAELLTATTLFVALGTSLLTQSLGLSMALGAFLAGLLLAETVTPAAYWEEHVIQRNAL